MTLSKHLRTRVGITLSFIPAITILLFAIGTAFLYLAQIVSGDKQLVNATDAGTLAAARQIITVTLTPSQVKTLPPEFQGLGVDANGNICPSGRDSSGNPALFNIIAYNNCATYALEAAFSAASDGSQIEISKANTIIIALNNFAQELDLNIQNSSNLPDAASNLMATNMINNLPNKFFNSSQIYTTLVPNSLKLGYYCTLDPEANVYFPSSFTSKDPKITNWANKVLSHTKAPNGSYFIAAAKPFDISKITGNPGFVGPTHKDLIIALVPFQSNQFTHLISSTGGNYFSNYFPNMSNVALPHNALQLAGQTNASVAGSNSKSGISMFGNRSNRSANLNLVAQAAAVANSPGQFASPPPSTTPPPPIHIAAAPPASTPPARIPPHISPLPPPPKLPPVTVSLVHRYVSFRNGNLDVGPLGTPGQHHGRYCEVTVTVRVPFVITENGIPHTVPPGTQLTIETGSLKLSWVEQVARTVGDAATMTVHVY